MPKAIRPNLRRLGFKRWKQSEWIKNDTLPLPCFLRTGGKTYVRTKRGFDHVADGEIDLKIFDFVELVPKGRRVDLIEWERSTLGRDRPLMITY